MRRRLNRSIGPVLSCTGFTLLELLISLTITAVIVTLVFGGLRIGVRAWEKGEADTEFQDRYRNVLSLLRKQLISAYISQPEEGPETNAPLFYFNGAEDSLTFFSHRSLVSGNFHSVGPGPVFVKYRITRESMPDGYRLAIYEENNPLLEENPDLNSAVSEDLYYELIAGAGEIRFEYLKVEKVDAETGIPTWFWQSFWNFNDEQSYPRAVRITFRPDSASAPLYVVIPIEKNAMS